MASQGITDFPSEWARLTAAGAVSSGEVKHERSNLVRRKQAHAHAHHALFGEMPRPTNLDGQQHGYQDFLSVAERRSKPVHRRGQGQAHWVGPSLRKGDRRRARKSGGSATSQHDARVGAQVQTEMERWTALPSGEVAVTHDGARGRDGVIKHQSRVPMHELNTQTSDPPAPEPQFQSQFDPPKLAPPLSNLGPTLQPALEKVAGVRSAINRRQTALRGGRGDCAKHSAWPEGPLLPAQERPTAAAVAMGRLALNPKIGPAQSMRAPPAAVDDEGMDYFQRGARGSSAHDFVGYAKARVSCGRRSPHRHTPIDYAARVGWARPAASVGNVSLPLKRRLRPPTPETGGVTRSPSKIFGGEASQTAVVHLSVGGESAIDGMPRIDLSGKNANADNPGSEEGTTGVGFRPWSDEETAALLRSALTLCYSLHLKHIDSRVKAAPPSINICMGATTDCTIVQLSSCRTAAPSTSSHSRNLSPEQVGRQSLQTCGLPAFRGTRRLVRNATGGFTTKILLLQAMTEGCRCLKKRYVCVGTLLFYTDNMGRNTQRSPCCGCGWLMYAGCCRPRAPTVSSARLAPCASATVIASIWVTSAGTDSAAGVQQLAFTTAKATRRLRKVATRCGEGQCWRVRATPDE